MLPRSFVLELLDFVLGANASIFQTSAVFEHALLSRLSHCALWMDLSVNFYSCADAIDIDPGQLSYAAAVPAICRVLLTQGPLNRCRICHLLLAQLHDLLDPTIEGHTQHSHLKIVLRASRTVLRRYHQQLGAKCGAFIEVLLSGWR